MPKCPKGLKLGLLKESKVDAEVFVVLLPLKTLLSKMTKI
jgi:hypothetical protein